MSSPLSLARIRNDLRAFQKHEVVLYGSSATNTSTSRSDLDIAIITRNNNPAKNKKFWLQALGLVPEQYDLKVFELLPLEIKAAIIDRHRLIFGDALKISEYFYHFRKLWADVKPRYYAHQFQSITEKMKVMEHSNPHH